MKFSRRQILIAGLGFAATGCATAPSATTRKTPGRVGPIWPEGVKAPTRTASTRPAYANPRPATPKPTLTDPALVAGVIARKNWTRHRINTRNADLMNGVNKITIHHEGSDVFEATSHAACYDRAEQIRQTHTRNRGWADIGYHYLIDPAGRVLEGRPVTYQGAHVSNHNEHNLGIVLLGNFEEQSPSPEQLARMRSFTRQMMALHNVSARAIRTHREFNPTKCPGRALLPHINQLRRTA